MEKDIKNMPRQQKAIWLRITYRSFSWGLGNLFLLSLVLVSSMLVVYYKHESRQYFSQLQQLQHEEQRLNTEWSQLLLEQGTWGSDIRVEQVARENLTMYLPEPNEVVVIR
jgi:cell division protein FtsL